jgi:hypothetical protein
MHCVWGRIRKKGVRLADALLAETTIFEFLGSLTTIFFSFHFSLLWDFSYLCEKGVRHFIFFDLYFVYCWINSQSNDCILSTLFAIIYYFKSLSAFFCDQNFLTDAFFPDTSLNNLFTRTGLKQPLVSIDYRKIRRLQYRVGPPLSLN